MSKPVEIKEDLFETEVLNAKEPVLVDFWATWCGPCRMLAPTVEEVAGEYEGRVKVCKVDVDACPTLAQRFGIMSIPTLIVFKGGKLLDKKVGVQPKAAIKAMLEQAL